MQGVNDDRQQALLKVLLKRKQGLAAEEIAEELKVTRPTLRRDLLELERSGYIELGPLRATGGRPNRKYQLTPKGYGLFPKQYAWFSKAFLVNLKAQLGSSGLRTLMHRLGEEIGTENRKVTEGKDLREKVEHVARLMSDLAYQAETVLTGVETKGGPPAIEASNCVFHGLAKSFPEICEFDIALLKTLTGADVHHEKCILEGSDTCRFRFRDKTVSH